MGVIPVVFSSRIKAYSKSVNIFDRETIFENKMHNVFSFIVTLLFDNSLHIKKLVAVKLCMRLMIVEINLDRKHLFLFIQGVQCSKTKNSFYELQFLSSSPHKHKYDPIPSGRHI